MDNNIHDFVIRQEAGYSKPVILEDGWNWNMKDHIRRSYLYKNSQFEEHNDDRKLRPFKNIVRPILNIQYRTEGFDVKDIEIYVNEKKNYYKSFLVRKYHENWALSNGIDTFIDELVESYVDYGGALVKNIGETRPERVDLRTIAFCNQTNFLSSPFGIKHRFSISELRGQDKWGNEGTSIEEFIVLSRDEKKDSDDMEIYEVHGVLPASWLGGDADKDVPQIQIVAFYKNVSGEKVGVTLFKSKEPKLPFKFLSRDEVSGRALGYGGIEELFESQIWTNYSEIQIMEMLNLASKVLFKTTDHSFKARNNLVDVDNGEVLLVNEGKDINQLDNSPRNLVAFDNYVKEWQAHAQQMGSASDSSLGEKPSSGTPFKLQELITNEGKGMHFYRQGKIAVFMDEIYRDWSIPHMVKEIMKGQEFLATLDLDELQMIAHNVVTNKANDMVIEKILSAELVLPEEVEEFKVLERENFARGGSKRWVEILKDEMKDAPLDVKTNIAGKQKNLNLMTDKLVNVLRQFIATPEIRQDPEMVKLLNVILESSGMSPMMFNTLTPSPVQQQGGGGTEPLKELAQTQ